VITLINLDNANNVQVIQEVFRARTDITVLRKIAPTLTNILIEMETALHAQHSLSSANSVTVVSKLHVVIDKS